MPKSAIMLAERTGKSISSDGDSRSLRAEVWRDMAPLRSAVSGAKAGRWIAIRAKIADPKAK